MSKLVLYGFLIAIAGCSVQAQPSPSPAPSPAPIESTAPSTKRFKLTLTLSEPQDLKVREGDAIEAGQLLSDRVRERERLEAQKQQLKIQIQRLNLPIIKPLPPPESVPIPNLPPPSYLEEEANVDRQSVDAEIAGKDRDDQQRMIDALQALDPETVPPSTLIHEQAKFGQRDREFQRQISEQALAKGKLDKAREQHAYDQYRHSVELSRRDLDSARNALEYQRQLQEYEKQQRDRTFQIAESTAKLQQIESQLAALSIIRSPYRGVIKKIKWVGQSDRLLTVELVMFINGSLSTAAPNATPSPQGDRKSAPSSKPGTKPSADKSDE